MKVLVITGDKSFAPGNPRFDLQQSAVERLAVVYWGRGAWWPRIPDGQFSARGGPASGWDVVTVQDPFWRGIFAWWVARRFGAKLNVQVHTDLSAQSFVRHVLAQIVLRHATGVRVVSERIKKQVEHHGVRTKIVVLPVYVDTSRFKAIVPQPHTQKTILWIGRFESEKNPLAAIEVLTSVRRAGIDAKLVMLGAGSLERELKAKAVSLPIEFPGWGDPALYLPKADVVLCTSKHESWGVSMVEALASGVPVVAPDVGIAREAGAVITARSDLALGVVAVVKSSTRGQLLLRLPNAEEWVTQWTQSL